MRTIINKFIFNRRNKPIKVEVLSLPSRKINYSLVVATCSVIVAMFSIYITNDISKRTIDRMDKNLKLSYQPIVILTTEDKNDSNSIILWNSGPGVAYDINIETHLADNFGNINVFYCTNVIQAALELETKTREQIFRNSMHVDDPKLRENHPTILPSGFENGYRTLPFFRSTLSGLFVIIRYKDGMNERYYSVWDGWTWQYGNGELPKNIKPEYKNVKNPIRQFLTHINAVLKSKSKSIFPNEEDFNRWEQRITNLPYDVWLEKEYEYMKQNGDWDPKLPHVDSLIYNPLFEEH